MVSYRESMVNYEGVLHLHLNLHVDLERSSSVRMCWVRLEWHNSTLDHRLPEKVRFKWTSLKHLFLMILNGMRYAHAAFAWWKGKHLHIRTETLLGLAWPLGPWLSGDSLQHFHSLWCGQNLTNSDTPPIREIRCTHICIHINNDTSTVSSAI